MEETWYCPFSGSARGVVEYQNTRIKPSNIPTYIRLFYFPINYCWFQLMVAAKGELKVDAASQPPFFFVFGPTSLCTNAPSPTKINVFFITSAEREVKDSRRSGMYQSCNFLTRLGKQSL